jgi:general secretion pathway protein E
VGELRDADASHLAARAALTGRLVLGGLYTPDGASTITRLLDCGIEPYVLCATLNGIVSQRLVRRLCRVCREASALDVSELAAAGLESPKDIAHGKVWRAKGCDTCQTGYDGRVAIFEILPVDHHIRSLIIKRAPGAQIRQSAVAKGMGTLTHAAWRAVLAGDTSVEELLRIVPAESK